MTDFEGTDLARRDRELWLAAVFVELADTLVDEFDLHDFLGILTERCVELLDGPEVGVMLADARGNLRHMAASSEEVTVVELLELQHDEGPCMDCFRIGQVVPSQRLDAAMDRWPRFAPRAMDAGYRMVTALPLRLRSRVIGAMNIFHTRTESVEPADLRLAQALADVATIGILQERALATSTELTTQLQIALNSRITIEQAKGMLAAELGIPVTESFTLLRGYARRQSTRIVDVASQVLARSLDATALQRGTTQDDQPGPT